MTDYSGGLIPSRWFSNLRISCLLLLLSLFGISSANAQLQYRGVNLAGAEFGESSLPGTYNVHYTYPTSEEADYYLDKGMNTLRLCFRWERLQRKQNAPLHAVELDRMKTFVDHATAQGAYVILNPHNYARYYGNVVGDSVPYAAFNDFWTRVANEFKANSNVIFGLVNEPNNMPTEQWFTAAQGAINAIRATGAQNLILVPGNGWSGAHSWLYDWYGTSNANVMLAITDPGNNFAFEVHQYLDDNSSGTSSQIVSPTIGQERLVDFTNWLRAHNRRGFLGEFGVANSTIGSGIGDEAIDNMLNYLVANDDVWMGWLWWAGGPWWGEYIFTIEPMDLGQPNESDRPVMTALTRHVEHLQFSDLEVISGVVALGGLDELLTSDNVDFSVRRNTTQVASVVEVEIESSSSISEPSAFEFSVESSAFYRTTVDQSIKLYNFSTQAFEIVDVRAAPRFVDQTTLVSASGDLSRFVEPETGLIRARVQYTSPMNRQRFTVSMDHLFWNVE